MENIISANLESREPIRKGEIKMGEEIEKKITEVSEPPAVVPQIAPIKKYTAELIGTMVLVLIGCGSAVIAGQYIGAFGIAFAFGLSVLAMVYAIGSISGCHINPAITISMLVAGKISVKDTIFYIVFQSIGAIIGAGILYGIASGSPSYTLQHSTSTGISGLGQNGFGSNSALGFSLTSVFVAEVVLTFIFVLVIHGSTHERVPKGFAGIPIGLTLVMIHLVAIPIDGTSVNPARSLGSSNNRRNNSGNRLETLQINQNNQTPFSFSFLNFS